MKIDKKLLINVGMMFGSFAVINVAMYFFLQFTQPKIGPRLDAHGEVAADSTAAAHDSTAAKDAYSGDAHAEAKPDSTAHDSTAMAADTSHAAPEHAAEVKPEPVAETPTEVAETTPPETAEEPEPEAETAQSVAAAAGKEADGAQLAKLAKLMESMKPIDAAAIASEMSTEQIVALVMKMKDRTAGKMLAALPVDQAAQVALKMSKSSTKQQTLRSGL